jgi:putative PEP-CTERM system TPR-repeat lipoprotein
MSPAPKDAAMPVMTLRFALPACMAVFLLTGCNWFVSTEQHIKRAEQYLAQGENRAAAIELQNALGSEPDNARARLLLARVSLRQGDVRAAEQELQRAIAAGAKGADTAILSADVQLAKGGNDALIAQLDGGKLALDAAQSATYRGLALLAKGNIEDAIAAFNQALAADPSSSEARLGLAGSLAQRGDADAALAEIENVLRADAADAHALLLKGRVLSVRGESRAASEALTLARKHGAGRLSDSESNGLLAMLVETETAAGDLAGARRDLAELSRQAPDALLVHLLSARIAMVEQNYPLAVTEAQKVVAAAPEHALARLLLGAALLANGNYNQAEAQLSELVRLAPENTEARKLLAECNLRLRRPDVALQVLSSPQQAESADPQVAALLGWANLQRGDNSVAIDLLKRSLAAQPDNMNLKLDLALAYISIGRNEEAVSLLEGIPATAAAGNTRRESLLIAALGKGKPTQDAQAEVARIVKANSNDVGILNVAAAFYTEQRDFGRARELLIAAAALDTKNTGTLANRARVEIASGDMDAAQKALRAILAVDPAHQAARITLARLALQRNDPKAAVTELEAARKSDVHAIEPRVMLAAYYLRERQTSEANAVLRELEALSESNPALAVVIGRLYVQAGRYDEALSRFQAAQRQQPDNAAWSLEVARAQLARGDLRSARVSVQKALDRDGDSFPANALMIALDMKEKREGVARARVAKMKLAHPADARVGLLEGEVNLALRDVPAAERAYVASYGLAPSSAAAMGVYRTRTIAHQPAATALLADWLTREPRDLGARMILAEGLLEQKQYTQSITQYERIVADGPANAMVLNNLAWLYSQKQDPRALESAKKAYELSPKSPAIADTYGWILVENDRALEAVPLLESAAAAQGAPAEVRYHLAVARARSGQREEARADLRKLVAGPGFEGAAEARKLLADLGG